VRPRPGWPGAFPGPVGAPLGGRLGRWAGTQGPFLTAEPAARFGLPPAAVEAVLQHRLDAGQLLRGEFKPGGREREWCDPEVLRRLRQRSLAALRREVEPADTDALARFLPAWHGIGPIGTGPTGTRPTGGGLDGLLEAVAQLQGVPIPASVLERDVLAARVAGYEPRMLDELAAAGQVVWVGAGPLGRDDGKVLLYLREDAAALRGETVAAGD